MNSLLSVRTLHELEPEADPRAAQLNARALEIAGLHAGDFLAVRDLMQYADCRDLPLRTLLLLLFMEFNAGSLCLRLTPENLQRKLKLLAGKSDQQLVNHILDAIEHNRWQTVISRRPDDFKPLVLVEIDNTPFLYLHKTWTHARHLKQRLQARLGHAETTPFCGAAEVLDLIRHDQGMPFQLNAEQQLALCLALLRRFLIVSGGPGTGKTSIVLALLRTVVRLGFEPRDIALVAPTGRAAQRLTEAVHDLLVKPAAEDLDLLHINGQTIHRLLAYSPAANRFRYNEHHPLPLKLLVVDEVSMVDVHLMERLLAAVPQHTHILFLGDKDQLPSVDAGAVLADLIPVGVPETFSAATLKQVHELIPDLSLPEPHPAPGPLGDTIVMLKTSYRSERQILSLAEQVNTQAPELQIKTAPDELWRTSLQTAEGPWLLPESATNANFHDLLDRWAIQFYLEAHGQPAFRDYIRLCRGIDWDAELEPEQLQNLDAAFDRLKAGQILTLVRNGPRGVDGINQYLDRELRRVFDPHATGRAFNGAPVIIQQNDHARELYNGDVGIVLEDHQGRLRAVFRRLEKILNFAVESLPPFDLAYAITVHKSQGSEYDRVLLVLPDSEAHRLLGKEILYTGLTRAKYAVYIAGRREVLAAAGQRRIIRETGLSMWREGGNLPDPEPKQPAPPRVPDSPP